MCIWITLVDSVGLKEYMKFKCGVVMDIGGTKGVEWDGVDPNT